MQVNIYTNWKKKELSYIELIFAILLAIWMCLNQKFSCDIWYSGHICVIMRIPILFRVLELN